jgi:cation transport ATPase
MPNDQNPYAAPLSKVGDRTPTSFSVRRLLLWAAVAANCLVFVLAVLALVITPNAELVFGAILAITLVSGGSLFLNRWPALFWLTTIMNVLIAVMALWLIAWGLWVDVRKSVAGIVMLSVLFTLSLVTLAGLLMNRSKRGQT